jgi:hypothetical protein
MWAKGSLLVYLPRLNLTVEAKIQDISLSGIGISFRLPLPLMPQEHIQLEARDSHGKKYNLEARIQRAVQRGDEYICGTEFIIRDEAEFADSIKFVYSDSQRWVDYWNRHTVKANPFRVLIFIMKMALKGFRVSLHTSFIFLIAPMIKMFKYGMAKVVSFPAAVSQKNMT